VADHRVHHGDPPEREGNLLEHHGSRDGEACQEEPAGLQQPHGQDEEEAQRHFHPDEPAVGDEERVRGDEQGGDECGPSSSEAQTDVEHERDREESEYERGATGDGHGRPA